MVNEKTGENAINIIPGAAGTITANYDRNNYIDISSIEPFIKM